MKIIFRTYDDKQSTFCKTFKKLKQALDFYNKGLTPDEPCESGLEVVIFDDEGAEVFSETILFDEWVWEGGKLEHRTV